MQLITNIAVSERIPDINSGFRIFKKSTITQYMKYFSDGFSFHSSSTLMYIFNKKRIEYLPTQTNPIRLDSKVTLRSGMNSLKSIFLIILIFRPARFLVLLLYALTTVIIPFIIISFILVKRFVLIPMIFFAVIAIVTLTTDIITKEKSRVIKDIP